RHTRSKRDWSSDVCSSDLADGAAWAHLEGTGGYVLLEGTHLRAVQAEREGCWSRNHTAGSEEVLRRHYATLEAVHSAEHSSYAYAVLPGADEEATRRAASDPGAEVVRNDEVRSEEHTSELQ